MNQVAPISEHRPTLLGTMASKYNMDPDTFAHTVRTTVMPVKHTNEQFAALMLVAKEYDLNPIVKEIYAFPAKGGGIVPIVSIDGWLNLVNSHPSCDGFETEFDDDENGDPISCTCRMYRKDRNRPVVVTEYFSECHRNTDPWKMKHRMLRHKAVIQAARYAFGFSGIYDEDEGAKIADISSAVPAAPPPPPPPSVIDGEFEPVDQSTPQPDRSADAAPGAADKAAPPPPPPPGAAGRGTTQRAAPPPPPTETTGEDWPTEPDAFCERLEEEMGKAGDLDAVEAIWLDSSPEDILDFPPDFARASDIYDKHRTRLGRPPQ